MYEFPSKKKLSHATINIRSYFLRKRVPEFLLKNKYSKFTQTKMIVNLKTVM